MKIKKSRCHQCGAPKVTLPKTAYMYCDFCSMFMDWDFNISISTAGSRMPGPEYRDLSMRMAADIHEAAAMEDWGKYKDLQRKLFDKHMESCPASYSPRIGDPDYREALLEYTTETYTLMASDEKLAELSEEMDEMIGKLNWGQDDGKQIVKSKPFWKLFDVFDRNTKAFVSLVASLGLLETHPDRPDERLTLMMAYSIFAEGWLPYLVPEDSEKLLGLTGLKVVYEEIEEIKTDKKHCGSCGGELVLPVDAKYSLCENCGFVLNVQVKEFKCSNCGGYFSFPVGKQKMPCPYCESTFSIV